jgi:site-specific recombinase XerD
MLPDEKCNPIFHEKDMKHPTLIEKVREVMRLKHYSYRTEQSYVYWIRKYLRYHNLRHPRDMREKEIRDFLSHLAVKQNVAASTQNQALSALPLLSN